MSLPWKIDLRHKIAVVTGGSGVLCSVMSRTLAACGAKVAVLGRTRKHVDKVVSAIVREGYCALGVPCDVTEVASIHDAHEQIVAAWGDGGCDLLINGAGGNHPKGTASIEALDANKTPVSFEGSFFDMDPAGITSVFNLNYQGTVLASLVFARDMVTKGRGSIINISSMASYHPLSKVMAYSNAKAAVNGFTQWLAVHLAPSGVRVNAIAPGFFLTRQNRSLLRNERGEPTERLKKILRHTPMDRLGKPEELLGALLFLASDEASGFVTGTILPVDGGFHAYGGV